MKKIFATMAILGAAHGAFAQGTVLFDNNTSGEIDLQIGTTTYVAARAIGESQQNPLGGAWHVALLYNATPGGGIAQNQLTDLVNYTPNVANNVNDGDGSFEYTSGGKEVVITTPAGSGSATFEVVSWIGTATTWAAAQAGGATFETQGADLVEFTATIANPATTPPGVPRSVNTASQWNGSLILDPTLAVDFTAGPTNGAAPLTVQFTSPAVDSANNAITVWNWSFGDGSTSTAQSPSHTYTNAGNYVPSLVASNKLGAAVPGFGPAITVLSYMPFFDDQASVGNGFYYLALSTNNIFGYYALNYYPYVYHQDLGFEYFFDASNSDHGAYLYDFTSGHFWYTAPDLFPYLYDFTLTNWLYCFPILDSNGNYTGRYYSNPRIFHDFNTGGTLFF